MKTNWSLLLENGAKSFIQRFAKGELSMTQTSSAIKNTEFAGEFRTLIRSRGTNEARILARKACRRRGLCV